MELSELFYYDENSPTGLRCKKTNKVLGYRNQSIGYRVKYLDKMVYVHRIIYLLLNEKIPSDYVIDHIDGDPFNNKYENLRVVPQAINTRNRKKSKRNSSGYTGVSIRSNGEIVARFMVGENKVGYKSFSISKYGYDTALKLAKEYRDIKISELNKQGAGYSDRHLSH